MINAVGIVSDVTKTKTVIRTMEMRPLRAMMSYINFEIREICRDSGITISETVLVRQ